MIDFLKDCGIEENVIDNIMDTYSSTVVFSFSCNEIEVKKIINYLNTLGIKNIGYILTSNLDFFFQTFDDVVKLFNKYDIIKLITAINNNPDVIKELR